MKIMGAKVSACSAVVHPCVNIRESARLKRSFMHSSQPAVHNAVIFPVVHCTANQSLLSVQHEHRVRASCIQDQAPKASLAKVGVT